MTKSEKIREFDPNGLASGEQIFGLPFTEAESETLIYPVPWEVTVSYASGTASGPQAILKASAQVDLYDPFLKDAWQKGIFLLPESETLRKESIRLRPKAEAYLDKLENGEVDEALQEEINAACENMVAEVAATTEKLLKSGKRIGLLGGDHSTPLGFIRTLGKHYPGLGILQIDAHADLRIAYEGFTYSHASIMYNALSEEGVAKLVQVGIRDYCEAEVEIIEGAAGKISCFYDRDIKHNAFRGMTWSDQCEAIIAELPDQVYISFDIDGLDPKLCPHTGTPVAGGFEVEQVCFLLEKLAKSGRKIVGFDLNEVAPGEDEWDANVGARLLYRLCNIMAVANK